MLLRQPYFGCTQRPNGTLPGATVFSHGGVTCFGQIQMTAVDGAFPLEEHASSRRESTLGPDWIP